MAGLPIPACNPGINARWKSAQFVWAKDGAIIVAGAPTAANDSVNDEYRLLVGRFDDADPPDLASSQELEATGVSYLSLDKRPDGTLDLFYFVDRRFIKHRTSRDGVTWSSATTVHDTGAAFEAKDAGMTGLGSSNEFQWLRHVYHPQHRFLYLIWKNSVANWGRMVGTPDGAGGIDWGTPIIGTPLSMDLGAGTRILTLQALPQGSLAIQGTGVWYEGLKSDGTYQTARTSIAANAGPPLAAWHDLKRDLMIVAVRPFAFPDNSITFLRYRLNAAGTALSPFETGPAGFDIWQTFDGFGNYRPTPGLVVDLKLDRDHRFWLLYPRLADGSLDFTHLEKVGEGNAGVWVPTPS